MRLARRWGVPYVDELLRSLQPEQFDEWAAFERLEPDTPERLHAQLTAIGGAVLYELQVLSYYVAQVLYAGNDEVLDRLKAPNIPRKEHLDPLAGDSLQKRRLKGRRPAPASAGTAATDGESGFVSPAVAVAMLRGAIGGSK